MEYKLADIFELQMGKTPDRHNHAFWDKGTEEWISIADLSNCDKFIKETKEQITQLAIAESGIKTIPPNTVVMSFKLSIGKLAITSKSMYSNEAIMAFVNKNKLKIDPSYLYYSFMHRNWDEGTNKAVMGKTLNKATLSQMKISVHGYDDQLEIVGVLDKVNSIIESRKYQLEELETLTKSRFVEIFGDVEVNPYGWKQVTIGSVIKSKVTGWSGKGQQRKKKSGEIAVLKVSAVTKGYFRPEEYKVLDDQKNIKKYVYPEKGDLLFSRANTREMVGATAIIKKNYPELILSDKLWKIQFTPVTNVYYMKYILSSKKIREKFSACSTGTSGSMYNVSMDKFQAIEIPMPPIELQEQFAAFVHQVDKLKAKIQRSLEETRLLFDSLMQKYFG